jgi:hypothetical protein
VLLLSVASVEGVAQHEQCWHREESVGASAARAASVDYIADHG